MIIKQLVGGIDGDLHCIGGSISDGIESRAISLYNWNTLHKNEPWSELLDLGLNTWKYFLINKSDYILGRSRAFCCQLADSKFKGKSGGILKEANKMAYYEWNSIPDENFLKINDSIVVTPYQLTTYFGNFNHKDISAEIEEMA